MYYSRCFEEKKSIKAFRFFSWGSIYILYVKPRVGAFLEHHAKPFPSQSCAFSGEPSRVWTRAHL